MSAEQWTGWHRVFLDSAGTKEYAVRLSLTDGGKFEACRIISRPPVSRRGFYQIEEVWRRLNPNGKTALDAFHLVSELAAWSAVVDQIEANARATGGAPS